MISCSSLQVPANKISKCWVRQSHVEFIVSSLLCPQHFVHPNPNVGIVLHNKSHYKHSQKDSPFTTICESSLCLNHVCGIPGNWKHSSAPNRHLTFLGVYQQYLSFSEYCLSLPTDIPKPGNSICEFQCCVKIEDIVEIWNAMENSWEIGASAEAEEHGREQRKESQRGKEKAWRGRNAVPV